MSIITQQVVEHRRFSGYDDPRYPLGSWFAEVQATGDASGDINELDIVFTLQSAAGLNSNMYSLEFFSTSTSDAAERFAVIRTINIGGPSTAGLDHAFSIATRRGDASLALSPVTPEALNIVPWFLGSQRVLGVTSLIAIQGNNVLGLVRRFAAEGYYWGARSVLANGGPQRPPTGLYRQ